MRWLPCIFVAFRYDHLDVYMARVVSRSLKIWTLDVIFCYDGHLLGLIHSTLN